MLSSDGFSRRLSRSLRSGLSSRSTRLLRSLLSLRSPLPPRSLRSLLLPVVFLFGQGSLGQCVTEHLEASVKLGAVRLQPQLLPKPVIVLLGGCCLSLFLFGIFLLYA